MIPYVAILVIAVLFLYSAIKILNEYERGVVFRLGRVIGAKGPGLIILIPMIDKMVRVDLRVVAMDVPSQDVITRDNVSVKVNAVLYFRVLDPNRAIITVENYLYATSQLAQTTLRSVCGQAEREERLSEREKSNTHSQEIRDKVVFTHTNIMDIEDNSIGLMDIIFCQNLLIYFEHEVRLKILDTMVRYLLPNGLIVLGAGEIYHWNNPQMELVSGDDILAYRMKGPTLRESV